jgi:hypothetical protein
VFKDHELCSLFTFRSESTQTSKVEISRTNLVLAAVDVQSVSRQARCRKRYIVFGKTASNSEVRS